MKTHTICLALLYLVSGPLAGAEPPKLLATTPALWAIGVDPSMKTLSLKFDQPLRPGFWDWFGRDVLSPHSTGHTTIDAERTTCTVDVTLQPGKTYICGLNEKGIPGVGFQNDKGASLAPTYLVFQTAGTAAPQDAPPRVKAVTPPNGATGIDPSRVKAIVIAFDQPMGVKKHGLHLFENNKPVDISKIPASYSTDGTTFTLPYNFRPATQYRLELNNNSDIGFSRATRVPLWPAQVSFTTL
ncbi:MAG: Bacterial Ig-like domain [Verrucomicrobiota bacterium]|jgi:hypothetical protein